ncbi:MAG: hypothetical protein OXO48_01805, partial [Caldilineaceae bacterium]|nr:hypothetical protein [Caldilineaceae bacterium]
MARHSCNCPAIQPQRFVSQPSYPAAPMTSAPGLPSSEEGSFTSKGGVFWRRPRPKPEAKVKNKPNDVEKAKKKKHKQ